MKKFLLIVSSLLFAGSLIAQQAQQPQSQTVQTVSNNPNQPQVVEIRLQQPPAPAPAPSQMVQNVSELVKTSQDFGAAIGGGLKNLANEAKDMTFGKDKTIVQGIDELSHTDAGKFTMAVIAWKVAGKDALDLLKRITGFLIGVPIQFFLVVMYIWVVRRFWLVRQVKLGEVINADKTRTITWGYVNCYGGEYSEKEKTAKTNIVSYLDNDSRHAGLFLSTLVLLILSAMNIGFVVF